MGLFDIFSGIKQKEGENIFPWIALNDVAQLDEIQLQKAKNIMIFKHSSRCGISLSVLNRFEKNIKIKQPEWNFIYLT